MEYCLASSTASLITTAVGDLGLPPELVGAEAQHGAVDRGHALERPVLGELAEERVDVVVVLLDAAHQLDRVRVGRRRLLVEQRRRPPRSRTSSS